MVLLAYVTVEEADDIIADCVPSGKEWRKAWETLSNADKLVYLIQATLKIDSLLFHGRKTSAKQPLAFPREGDTEVPDAVKMACALEACSLVWLANEEELAQKRAASGVKSVSLGSISETYMEGQTIGLNAFYNPAVPSLLRQYVKGSVRIV